MNAATSTTGPPARASEVAICVRPEHCRCRNETRAANPKSIARRTVRLPGTGDEAHAHPRHGAHDLTGEPLGTGPGRKALVVLRAIGARLIAVRAPAVLIVGPGEFG